MPTRLLLSFWRNKVITKCATFHLKRKENIGSPSTRRNGIISDPSWNEFIILSPCRRYISHLLVEQ
jgi:hypothetical protein